MLNRFKPLLAFQIQVRILSVAPRMCFIPEFLRTVANKIGRFLCLDLATATLARPSAACVCVEIELRKPPPQSIWIGLYEGCDQQILYEKLPKFCNSCHSQGHLSVSCHKSIPVIPQPLASVHVPHPPKRPHHFRQNVSGSRQHVSGQNPPLSASLPFPPNILVKPPSASIPAKSSLGPSSSATPSIPLLFPVDTIHAPQNQQHQFIPEPHQPLLVPSPDGIQANENSQPSICHNQPLSPSKALLKNQKRKSVSFKNQQTNVSANQEFFESVSHKINSIDQSCITPKEVVIQTSLTSGPVPNTPVISSTVASKAMSSSTSAIVIALPQSSDIHISSPVELDSGSSIAMDSQPNSPLDQEGNNMFSAQTVSEGEEQNVEPSHSLGHNTNDLLQNHRKSSKKTKDTPTPL
ncbi:uncharacterized protein LOC109842237 [Asparagus officinalis]|uniref:uncharacterized protein LOC109842237 n=1 Tax=Asparagus officinalis TaxID=4686 RepID=UPI00098E3B4E|nr:uncharacterized protein LOC109842237 [Asparagus officinalis]